MQLLQATALLGTLVLGGLHNWRPSNSEESGPAVGQATSLSTTSGSLAFAPRVPCVYCVVCADFWPWDETGHETSESGEGARNKVGPPHECTEGSPCNAHISCGESDDDAESLELKAERLALAISHAASSEQGLHELARGFFSKRVAVNDERQVLQVLSCDSATVIAQVTMPPGLALDVKD